MEKILFFIVSLLLSSCTLQSTFYLRSDKTGSFVMNFKLSKELSEKGKGKNTKDYSNIPREWMSLYEFMKSENDSIAQLPEDSVKDLKKIFIRFNFDKDNEFSGVEMKMDSIGPDQWSSYNTALSYISKTGAVNTSGTNEKNTKLPFAWDGSVLNIFIGEDLTEEFNKRTASAGAKDQKVNAEMLKGLQQVFGGGDIEIIYKFVLDKKISKVKGKNDLVKKLDDYTMEVNVKMFELMEKEAKGKKMKHKDQIISVYTK